MKTMYVYILECSDKTYYTGVTNNLEKRLIVHERGINPNSYTYKRRPVNLVDREIFNDPMAAIRFEKRIKKWSQKKKKALIAGDWDLLPELSKSKTPK